MSGTYTINLEPTAYTTEIDLFEILAGSASIIQILEWEIFQISDVGDAQEEIIDLEEVRGYSTVTSGSGGAAYTPKPQTQGDGASAATVEVGNTTRLAVGTGTIETIKKYGWNVRSPYTKVYIPEARPIILPSQYWTLGLDATPTDSVTVGGSLTFYEFG